MLLTALNFHGALLHVMRVVVKVHGTGENQRQPADERGEQRRVSRLSRVPTRITYPSKQARHVSPQRAPLPRILIPERPRGAIYQPASLHSRACVIVTPPPSP